MKSAWIGLILTLSIPGLGLGVSVDFETLPGGAPPTDQMLISDQYNVAPYWVRFDLQPADPERGPRIALVGPARTAFYGPAIADPCQNESSDNDKPAAGQNMGCAFLTDDAELGSAHNLRITYTQPVESASGVVLDIDQQEEWTVTAYDVGGSPFGVLMLGAGDPGTGDGVGTPWGFWNPAGIGHIDIVYTGTSPTVGLAFDNLIHEPMSSPQGCNLETLTHDWDFAQGPQGFTLVDCDNGGASIWQHGACSIPGAPPRVWGTILNGDYVEDSGLGLVSPPFFVDDQSYLVEILHYVDTEYEYDGCNVSVGTWPGSTVIHPMDPYTVSQISPSSSFYAYCVDGEPGWTGPDQRWRVDCFDLSEFVGQQITLELDFGSDASVNAPGWYVAHVKVGAPMPPMGVCCDPATSGCEVTTELACMEMGGDWHPEWDSCDPNPCVGPELPDLVLQVGDWINPEPWHSWVSLIGENGIPVQLLAWDDSPPGNGRPVMVEFLFSVDDGQSWEVFGQDDDGTQPVYDSEGDDPMLGDGYSALLFSLPDPLPQPAVLFKAIVYYDNDLTQEVETVRVYDPAPPSLSTVEIDDWMVVEDETMDLMVYPNGTEIERIAVFLEAKIDTFIKGIPGISQHIHSGTHCVPTAVAQCLRYFEQRDGDTVVTGGLSDYDLVGGLAGPAYMKTNLYGVVGTTGANWLGGMANWIKNHGSGYTVRSFWHYSGAPWTQFDWKRMRNQLERCQNVLNGVAWTGGGGHAVTLNSVINTPLQNGRMRIGFMDPWIGAEDDADLDINTGNVTNYGVGGDINLTIVVSPVEPEAGGGGPGEAIWVGPDPFPDPIPIPFPNPGPFFIHVDVINVEGHSHRTTGIVQYEPTVYTPGDTGALPQVFYMSKALPNPFRGAVQIPYTAPVAERVRIEVFDVQGRRVRTLVDQVVEPGFHAVAWDGRDNARREIAQGTYYVRMQSATYEKVRPVTLLR